MKKVILMLFIMVQSMMAAKEIQFTQEELLVRLVPVLKTAENYEKYKKINARKATAGEVIETVTSDGLETKNTAQGGEYIVRNTTEANEMYIVKGEKFEKRYKYIEDLDDEWGIYKAMGVIKAVEVDKKLIKSMGTEEEFFFMAPWGEKMVVKKGDYLVSPLDYSEVYRIAKKEFFETYRLQEK